MKEKEMKKKKEKKETRTFLMIFDLVITYQHKSTRA